MRPRGCGGPSLTSSLARFPPATLLLACARVYFAPSLDLALALALVYVLSLSSRANCSGSPASASSGAPTVGVEGRFVIHPECLGVCRACISPHCRACSSPHCRACISPHCRACALNPTAARALVPTVHCSDLRTPEIISPSIGTRWRALPLHSYSSLHGGAR